MWHYFWTIIFWYQSKPFSVKPHKEITHTSYYIFLKKLDLSKEKVAFFHYRNDPTWWYLPKTYVLPSSAYCHHQQSDLPIENMWPLIGYWGLDRNNGKKIVAQIKFTFTSLFINLLKFCFACKKEAFSFSQVKWYWHHVLF